MGRRTDVGFGLLVSTVAHGAVLTAAGSFLSQGGGSVSPALRSPLQIVLIEREAFESELDFDPFDLPLDPVRSPQVHHLPIPPEWPVLDVDPILPSPRVLPLPVRREELDEFDRRARPEVEYPSAPPLTREVEEPRAIARSASAEFETSGLVPIGDASALVLHRPDLCYPARALRRGIEGVARVAVEVGPGGAVVRAWILESSGSRSLDRVAVDYVAGFVFDAAAVAAAGRGSSFSKRVRFTIE